MEKKFGHCIICHQDNQELTDEHVIPQAIGGYYHIYNVCKTCNSKLGDNVDIHLLNNWLIKAARYQWRLKGYSNTVPNPILGDGVLATGEKVRVEMEKDGSLYVHLLPSSPEVSADGSSMKMAVDVKDKNLISKMQTKVLKKCKIDSSKFKIDTQCVHQQIEHPEVRMRFEIDIQKYKIALLKIAYEFTVDRIPEYYNDDMAKLYSQILHDGATDRLGETGLEGDALVNSKVTFLEDLIDFSRVDRHILCLLNLKGKLYCIIKLFDCFCQLIRMSDKAYDKEPLVAMAINEFNKEKSCKILNASELMKATMQDETTSFSVAPEYMNGLNSLNQEGMGIACNVDGDNIIYDANGNPIYTESHLLLNLEKINMVKKIDRQTDRLSITYILPFGCHYMIMPTALLVRITEITKTTSLKKL